MATPTYQVFAIKYAHVGRKAWGNFVDGDPHEDWDMPLDYYVWAIVGGGRTFVVDTGFDAPMAKKRDRKIVHPVEAGLEAQHVAVEVHPRRLHGGSGRHAEIQQVDQYLGHRAADAVGAAGTQRETGTVREFDHRRRHHGGQPRTLPPALESPVVEVLFAEHVVQHDARAGQHVAATFAIGGGQAGDVALPVLLAEDAALIRHQSQLADDARDCALVIEALSETLFSQVAVDGHTLRASLLRGQPRALRVGVLRLFILRATGQVPGRAELTQLDRALCSDRGEVWLASDVSVRASGDGHLLVCARDPHGGTGGTDGNTA